MKFIDEYRRPEDARRLAQAIHRSATRPWTLMEICGGQTHAIVKFGIDELLPEKVTLVHGPGCPVCVTPLELIEKALEIASRPGVVFCSFGDMLRVPGESRDLLSVKAAGGDVRIVYSPLDAVRIARELPDREVVFFAVGFETTAPANAMAVVQAQREGLSNFSQLVSHVLVPPAMETILSSCAGKASTTMIPGDIGIPLMTCGIACGEAAWKPSPCLTTWPLPRGQYAGTTSTPTLYLWSRWPLAGDALSTLATSQKYSQPIHCQVSLCRMPSSVATAWASSAAAMTTAEDLASRGSTGAADRQAGNSTPPGLDNPAIPSACSRPV